MENFARYWGNLRLRLFRARVMRIGSDVDNGRMQIHITKAQGNVLGS